MEIWLDTIDTKTLGAAASLGILGGVTTNPSLIAQAGKPLEEILATLLKCYGGKIAVQVTAIDHVKMVEQAEMLADVSERIVVKIPATQEGLKAIHSLHHLPLSLMATAIFSPHQALFAAHAGADYLAPYYSRMEHPFETVEEIVIIQERYQLHTQVLVASLKTKEHFAECLQIGVDGATIPRELFDLLTTDERGTFEALEQFSKDWKKAKISKLLSLS